MAVHLEAVTVPQTLRRVCTVYGTRWIVFGQITAATMVPLMMLSGVILGFLVLTLVDLARKTEEDETNGVDPTAQDVLDALEEHMQVLLVLVVIYGIAYTLLSLAGRAAMIRATAEVYLQEHYHYRHNGGSSGRSSSSLWYHCFQQGLRQSCHLLGAGLIVLAMSFVGLGLLGYVCRTSLVLAIFVLLILPWIQFYVAVRLSLIYPAIVVEKDTTSAWGGIRRSWELSNGGFCDIACSWFLLIVLQLVVTGILAKLLIVGMKFHEFFQPGGMLLLIISFQLPSFVFMPCLTILQTVLYLNRRIFVEGLTMDALARDLCMTQDEDGFVPTITTTALATPLLMEEGNSSNDDNGGAECGVETTVEAKAVLIVEEEENDYNLVV